ncbi:MAG: ABC transporter ATP-binding protein, partial [Lactococcus lactis]|nr:ABC transporter ATP-binding protein [Lactococcus lactis]
VAFGTVEELRSQFNQPKASLDEIYLALTKGNIPNSKEVVEAGKTHE